jgi:hypothetical protein
VAAYTQKHLVSWIVLLNASLVTSWSSCATNSSRYTLWYLWQTFSTRVCKYWNHLHVSVSLQYVNYCPFGCVINSQFYRFLRHCSCEEFFVSQMVSLIVLMKNKDYPLKILLKRIRGLLNKQKFLNGISTIGGFWITLVSGELLVKPTWSLFFSIVLFSVFCLSCCVFLFLFPCVVCSWPVAWQSLPRCFWICSRILVHRLVWSLAFSHCRELKKSVRKLGYRNHNHTWYYCRPFSLFFVSWSFPVLSFLLWNSLWLVEEELTFCLSFFKILYGWLKKE